MYGCESWTIKKAEPQRIGTFEFVVMEKILESPLDYEEIKPVNPKGNQLWIFVGRTDAETEASILWPFEELTNWKRPWCWERLKAGGEGDNRGRGLGWHHWLNELKEFEQVTRDGEGEGAWHAVVHGVTNSRTTTKAFAGFSDLYIYGHSVPISGSCPTVTIFK